MTLTLERPSAEVEAVRGTARLRRTRVHEEENAPFIPPGAEIGFRPAAPEDLKPGTFVLVRRGPDLLVRRLIGLVEGPAGPSMRLATYGGASERPLSSLYLLGEVVEVEVGDRRFDPSQQRGLLALRNYLTEFNTCSPFTRLARMIRGN